MSRYNPSVVEAKWRKYWEDNNTFAAPRLPSDLPNNPDGKKAYVLDMFPSPSAQGLHVGHPEGYTATDIYCRYMRMNGYAVMHPMGWDAFGLPAEQHAKKTGIHPRITTKQNIANFRRQLHMLGFSYDWDRELATTDVDYFRWTQYIFLVLFNAWYDKEQKKARPISELPIPEDVRAEGPKAVQQYIDDARLAYQIEAPVNWCPELGTVLANEEVVGGVSERGGFPVERLPLRQWMLRITAYADRLEEDLADLDWSESVKALQRNWIGKSVGAEVDFFIGPKEEFDAWKKSRAASGFTRKPAKDVLRVFTTRPDTLYGASYMVIAPEHPLVERLTTSGQKEVVEAYRRQASFKSDLDRTDLAKEKTGVFSGSYALNPVNGEQIPIWIADYVLASYGTGAIMAVPAHDTRDFEFAKQFDLPIIQVVAPGPKSSVSAEEASKMEVAFTETGVAINSGEYDGTPTEEFKPLLTAKLESVGLGRKTVNYKLRDWLFSRQHFWGEPFPLLRELDENGEPTGIVLPLDPSELPLDLPEGYEFDANKHSPEPPLEHAPKEWLYVERNGKKYKRETNTMPQWAGSCWYYLRYLDPKNSENFVDPEIEKAWAPVDLYVGGAEHAVLHLLYARFWHKVLYDFGLVSRKEPFQRLVNQGMILGEMEYTGFQTEDGAWVSAREVDVDKQGAATLKSNGTPVTPIKVPAKDIGKSGENYILTSNPEIVVLGKSEKMSKSRGNVVNPDDVVAQYGADSLRLYEMFMGPLEAVKPWNQDGVNGVRNFLDRVWRMIITADHESDALNEAVQDVEPNEEQNLVLHKTIKKVTEDIKNLSYNTAIACMMEFANFFSRQAVRPKSAMKTFVLLLSPFAPHIAEELWALLGASNTLAYEPWPTWDENALKERSIVVPVQINGKMRGRIEMAADSSPEQMEAIVLADPRIASLIEGKTIVKKIVVPGKMVNLVVK
ncbi:MAG: leucine--tRNA ligase [Thermoguttaceae bacterium]|nr:leucine--tRNA ligase [Thermoguttaceae bacterium]